MSAHPVNNIQLFDADYQHLLRQATGIMILVMIAAAREARERLNRKHN